MRRLSNFKCLSDILHKGSLTIDTKTETQKKYVKYRKTLSCVETVASERKCDCCTIQNQSTAVSYFTQWKSKLLEVELTENTMLNSTPASFTGSEIVENHLAVYVGYQVFFSKKWYVLLVKVGKDIMVITIEHQA